MIFFILLLPLFTMMGCSDSDNNSTSPVDRFVRSTEFGGNPENALVAGVSSGAHDALNLMISPLAESLFHKVL